MRGRNCQVWSRIGLSNSQFIQTKGTLAESYSRSASRCLCQCLSTCNTDRAADYASLTTLAHQHRNVTRSDKRFHHQPFRTMTTMKTSSTLKPEVTVTPAGHLLVDDELRIRVQGLDSGQQVTVHTGINVSGRTMESCCQFRADENGVVDLYTHPSLSGSYTGVSPMGIFWSMVPTPDMPKGFRMMFKKINKPIRGVVSVYPGNFTAEDVRLNKPSPLVSHVIERWYKSPDVTSISIKHGRLRGTLFLPPGPGPFPGVVDLFGTAGGLLEFRSALFASRGLASFALAYFMYPDLPDNLLDQDLDYFLEAVHWLSSHPQVHREGVGVVGVSKGGDLGLMMAANSPQVRALVNINGCTFNANFPIKYSGGDIPAVMMDQSKFIVADGTVATGKSFVNLYDEKDLIPVWRHNPKVLNILGLDDVCSPYECMFMTRDYYPNDKVDNYTILSYPGAGHLIEPPYTPLCSMSYHKAFDQYIRWGGHPKPHADAQEDAWRNILKFFHTNIPKTTPENSKL